MLSRALAPDAEALLEHAPCGYVVADDAGRVLWANATLLGWLRLGDLVGQPLESLLAPGPRAVWRTLHLPLLLRGRTLQGLALELVGNGLKVPALVGARSLATPSGGCALHLTILEAGDRRAFEAALVTARDEAERSARRAVALQRVSAACAGATSPEQLHRLVLEAVGEAWGASDVALWLPHGGHLSVLAPRGSRGPAGPPAVNQLALRTGRPVLRDGIFAVPFGYDGDLAVLSVASGLAQPLTQDDAAAMETTAVLLEQAYAGADLYRELRETEERFRLTFDNAPLGVALVNLDGSWLRVNAPLCDIVGWSKPELLARTFQEITHPDDLDADLELLASLVEGAIDAYRLEKRYLRADGSVVHVEISVALADNEHGEPQHFIAHVQDISERLAAQQQLQEANDRLAEAATHDALTGLPNRRVLAERLEQALDRSARHGGEVGVLFCDLDRFKAVNDRAGHQVGDQVLAEVARRIRALLRPTDTVARVGGDEFVVLLEDPRGDEPSGAVAPGSGARAVAERIRRAVERPVEAGGSSYSVGVSVGIASASPGDDAEQVLSSADRAMYAAKRATR